MLPFLGHEEGSNWQKGRRPQPSTAQRDPLQDPHARARPHTLACQLSLANENRNPAPSALPHMSTRGSRWFTETGCRTFDRTWNCHPPTKNKDALAEITAVSPARGDFGSQGGGRFSHEVTCQKPKTPKRDTRSWIAPEANRRTGERRGSIQKHRRVTKAIGSCQSYTGVTGVLPKLKFNHGIRVYLFMPGCELQSDGQKPD